MQDKKRTDEFGMISLTLADLDVIFIEPSKAKDGSVTERDYSYVFAKTFKRGGEKTKHFTSVTVSVNGLEVSVSSHFVKPNNMLNKLMKFERADTKEELLSNSSELHLAEHLNDVPDLLPTQENNSSFDKDKQSSEKKQTNDQKNTDNKTVSDLSLVNDENAEGIHGDSVPGGRSEDSDGKETHQGGTETDATKYGKSAKDTTSQKNTEKQEITNEIYDPPSMSDNEKERRGKMLREAEAIEVVENQITASKDLTARKAAENWWDDNISEPLFYEIEVGEVEINQILWKVLWLIVMGR